MLIAFTKAHGLGNDYIYVDGSRFPNPLASSTIRAWSDRHTGIGGDGVIVVSPESAPGEDQLAARMTMFNADGSRAEMCGNGLRCAAWLARRWGFTDADAFEIATDSGSRAVEIVEIRDDGAIVATEVGRAELSPTRSLDSALGEVRGVPVDVGNPHFVVPVSDVARAAIDTFGPAIETHADFPDRTNVPFLEVRSRAEIAVRVWERGAGETRACGTGAVAAFAVAHEFGDVDDEVTAHLSGGALRLSLRDDIVWQVGPATGVFDGEVSLEVVEPTA